MDPVLMEDSDMLCDTLNQICELEQQQSQQQAPPAKDAPLGSDLDVFDWAKSEGGNSLDNSIRPAEPCNSSTSYLHLAGMSTNVSDTNKTVEDALYCDDDDDDSSSISNPIKIELTPSQTWQTTDSKDNGAGLLSDIDLPNMLDMFNAMYADQTGAPLSTNTVDHHSTKFHPLSIHIPTPISIPQYQPLQPAAVTYQNTRLLAPNSTPNIHFTSPVYFNHLTPPQPPPSHRRSPGNPTHFPSRPAPPNTGLSANALLSPTYHGTIAIDSDK
ncbi:hypothetical protein AaE_015772 [Aphanomyces astaci]|uniref:Uncharacterized protein n=1 Tax=Aphanomyces astaci TaxID=112090 RepID=A0A6A4YV18_APHAT|nr:hypothetical protein AaE_015772 [Aphanomyces astaci]